MSEVRPNGFYVLIEMEEVKSTTESGIILGDVRREQDACDIGYVRAVGNTAFIGMPGCNPTDYNPTEPQYKMTPAQIWGIDIGDKVEYRRHEGKVSGIPGNERMRYIPDTQIIGKVL